MPDSRKLLALRLGAIFQQEINPEELRYPGLSKSAQSLLAQNPQKYGEILESLLDGKSVAATARKTKQQADIVQFINRLHPEIRESLRSHSINNLEQSLVELSGRMATEVNAFEIKDVPRALSVVTEQLALLTGHATSRVEISNVSREKLLAMFNSLMPPKTIKETDV
jgi:hypothetical protein